MMSVSYKLSNMSYQRECLVTKPIALYDLVSLHDIPEKVYLQSAL